MIFREKTWRIVLPEPNERWPGSLHNAREITSFMISFVPP
jgi:hypothetical protein